MSGNAQVGVAFPKMLTETADCGGWEIIHASTRDENADGAVDLDRGGETGRSSDGGENVEGNGRFKPRMKSVAHRRVAKCRLGGGFGPRGKPGAHWAAGEMPTRAADLSR